MFPICDCPRRPATQARGLKTRIVRWPKELFLNLKRAGRHFKKRRRYFMRNLGLSKKMVLRCECSGLWYRIVGYYPSLQGSQCLRLQGQTADEEQMSAKMSVMYSTKDITPHLRKTESPVCELNLNIPFIILHIFNNKIKTHFNY